MAVAKGRSLFGDPTADIQELTQVIKQDLAKLNSDIAALQQQVKARAYHESKHVRTHTSSVVVSLQVRARRVGKVKIGVTGGMGRGSMERWKEVGVRSGKRGMYM